MTISQELDAIVSNLENQSINKNYWLVRTQSGTLYDAFRGNNFIALDHTEITLSEISKYRNDLANDHIAILKAIKAKVRSIHEKLEEYKGDEKGLTRHAGLIANQIFKFIYQIKKGDIVVIPSYKSDTVSFGVVTEDYITSYNTSKTRKSVSDIFLSKKVRWLKDVSRNSLDPFLYKMFTAHQAINDVTNYAEVIERSIKDFFVLDEEAHVIVNVQTNDQISAQDLFGLGTELLNLIDEFSKKYNLDTSSKDLSVAITLNSPGKIDLSSKVKKTTYLAAILLAAFGGGYESGERKLKTEGLPGMLKVAMDFITEQREQNLKRDMYEHYKDSLKIKDPEDLIKLLKQASSNKDLPK